MIARRYGTMLFFFLLFCLPLIGQTEQALKRFEFEHKQMGTIFRFVFYCRSDSAAAALSDILKQTLDDLNASMSDYLPESELNALCAKGGTDTLVPVSDDLWRVLVLSKEISEKSGGAFDITVGSLTRLWRRARHLNALPDSAHLSAALQKTGYRKIEYFPMVQSVRLQEQGMQLDLGGIAQGYAADKCLQILKQQGIFSALIDAGGDIAIGDPPPDAPGWTIEVPVTEDNKNKILIHNCGITTSGAQFKYFEFEGKRYSHIIDPVSGWPLTHRVLSTVLAPSAVEADAWATALNVMGKKGVEMLEKTRPDIKCWLLEMNL